jgi:pyrimidine operon attenuation protein / uracil phosphoribosyltransferase
MNSPAALPTRQPVLEAPAIAEAVVRVAGEIVSRHGDHLARLGLVGLPTRGIPLARRLAARIQESTGITIPVGHLDVTFHRDDLDLRLPVPGTTDVPFDLTGRIVILVDDVLCSGRTVRAALDALIEFGRPEAIRFFALIDRGHHRLPICADFVGATLETHWEDDVMVLLTEVDGRDAVEISTVRGGAGP